MRLRALAGASALLPLLVTLGIAFAAAGSGTLTPVASYDCLPSSPSTGATAGQLSSLNPTQLGHAKTIYDVSVAMGLPVRAAVIAVATALQESALRNLANSHLPRSLQLPHDGVGADHDSVGLFQQRPLPPDGAGGWGTVQELMTPAVAATKFYTKMRTIPNWQTLPLTVIAQTVQESAFPDAYAQHEPLATAIVNAITNGTLTCSSAGPISASGWTIPAAGPIVSGFRTPDRPTHSGVDIGVGKGTPIHAAAAGVVLVATCQATAPDGSAYSCNVDGGVSIAGCGWYVDILHADLTVTRYCHMLQQPFVHIGQSVAVGQIIGVSGSSGNSSGPHLHYETHVRRPADASTAVDPIVFMAARGLQMT
jgi:murein DD-endopeptidase MepM/ murein hydrolase activator NlpD